MTTEQEFLAAVARRLGRGQPLAAPPPPPCGALPLPPGAPADPGALAERFAAELARLGGKCTLAGSAAAAAAQAVHVAETALRVYPRSVPRVVRWDHPLLNALDLDLALDRAGFAVTVWHPGAGRAALVAAAAEACLGITAADLAVAETGALVMASHAPGVPGAPGRGRVVGLLPPVHLALVPRDRLVWSQAEAMRWLAAAGPLPPQVVFASGPSRTADIENELSVGVHGPGQVHAVLV